MIVITNFSVLHCVTPILQKNKINYHWKLKRVKMLRCNNNSNWKRGLSRRKITSLNFIKK